MRTQIRGFIFKQFGETKSFLTKKIMSTSLYWRPIPLEPKKSSIGSLKYDLHEEVFGSDHGDASVSHGPHQVGKELLPFLRGIIDGNNDGEKKQDAIKLMSAIHQHGKVEILIY
jgi:hypothetical protein